MTQSPLDALHDVMPPEQVSWWPLSMPMWALICVSIILLIALTVWLYKNWQFGAAKREAIKLSQQHQQDALALHGIVKRLTKHYYGASVASQSSAAWCQTLNAISKAQFKEQDITSFYKPDNQNEHVEQLMMAIKTFKTKECLDV
ncbi:DUF4381 domain-containing protein [Pseudoalteromonas luteoviolacea]|uniref:DUF4381 domain-containing protein n=1 Tax=Pseudoalteromonas luteoviolacea S4054 TaxID=1129367 RepID=A0A0F6AHX2_9GAMM|nr:DUF4381 domain-containing protein [Pseudoalteromonas luteoviolacea]AOT07938.1 hypothetical protein S4054249_08815 [Pseudoalteromonas luteoviolacea]AOT12854.1 hypothetical protein S40542_08815 [Pseudoalteromonas luteoviolacea]AOT17767.1 hypothetical protein S4054_08810 [Pseudoalteromonas luteoviolacea]KKE85820.1 hypothetical protein N479_00170 [Pseudoalteromonas luteoviolacea S4054]KZN74698.1 hypothetical protein N481_08550 [Pseudoalteromonas luteoviolacea S4047-1]